MSVFKNQSTSLAQLVETNERYIMSGQCYNKLNMKFEHMNFQPIIQTSPFYTPSLIRRCTSVNDTYTNWDWHDRATIGNMFIVDKDDPTVTYSLIDSAIQLESTGINESHTSVAKIKTENDITQIIWKKGFRSTLTNRVDKGSYTFKEVLGQTDTHIYVSIARSFYQNYNGKEQTNEHFIVQYNKLTGAAVNIFDYESDYEISNVTSQGTSLNKLYETENKIYFLFYSNPANTNKYKDCNPGENCIYYIDKVTNTITLAGKIAKDKVSPSGGTLYSSQGILKDNFVYFYQLTNITEPKMMLVKVNTVTDEVSNEVISITFNEKVTKLPSITKNVNVERTYSVRILLKEHDGKKYLHIIGYSTFNKYNDTLSEIVSLLVNDEDFTLTAQSKFNPFNGTIKGYIECIDENLLIVSNRLSLKVLKFNTMSREFEEMQIIDTPHFAFGCDSQNNIWICDTSNQLEKHTIDLPTKINVVFKEKSYDYVGTDIDTELHIDAVNYLSQRVIANLELTLKGPITFADGQKSTTVATIREGVLKVPVKIKGSGSLSVYPRVMF